MRNAEICVCRPEPALVSAGPWQGLDATASAERETIRGLWRSPQRGSRGTAPGGGSGGLCRAGPRHGRGGLLLDKSELQTIEWRDHGPVDRNAFLFIGP